MGAVSLWLLGGVKAVGGGIRLMARVGGNGSQTLETDVDVAACTGRKSDYSSQN